MQRFIRLHNTGRRLLTFPLLISLLLTLFMLLNIVPSYAQSDPAADTDTLAADTLPADTVADENAPFDPASAISVAAIAAPTHISPAPDSVSTALTAPPVGVPSLSWSAVAGATRYNVQISTSAGFATTLVNQNTVATTYTPREVMVDGTYFWRVRAESTEGWGNFSEPWSFRKDWSAEGLVKPILTAPADDPNGQQVITSFSPEHFSWEPVPGAAAYNLEISVSPSFNEAKPYRATTIKTHHTPLTQFANNQYYWRVIPIDYRGNAGEPSEVRSFTFGWNQIPTPLLPEDDVVARFIPRFTWTAVAGASAYILDISSDENFSELISTVSTRNTSFTPEITPANNTDYFWRVRAVSPQKVNGPFSIVRRFRANWVQPPTLLSPPVRSIQHIYPYFSWTPVAGAERYQIQIANGTAFDNVIVDITLVNATGYTQAEWKEVVLGADYFWRVRAEDAQGNTTNWSNEQSFRFSASPPPNLVYPEPYYVPDAEGMPIHTNRTIGQPIFVWDTTHEWLFNVDEGDGPAAFLYPDYYRLEVATSREFNNIVFSIDSAGQGAAPTLANPFNNLIDKTIYYWRVTPIQAGSPMAEGTVWETRIDRTLQELPLDSDNVPDISHPQDGYITVDTAPIMGWLPVANAHHYEVEITNRRDFSAIVDSADALFAYYVPWQGRQTPMPPGTYWWRVRAKDAADAPLGDWSGIRHFFVMDNLMVGNDYDYMLPEGGTLLSPGVLYDAELSQVATDTTTVAAPYNVGPLHVVDDRSISMLNRNWVIAFGADAGVATSLTYALYFDVNQQENVGGTTDPRNKPVVFDPLYRPEYVIYLERANDDITAGSLYEWNGSGWVGAFSLGSLGGSFDYDPLSQAVQVIFPYSAIIFDDSDQFSGGLALTVYSTPSAANSAPVDSIPAQGATLDRPAIFSNMPVLLYPFDTPMSNPIVFHELPTLRWRMPGYNSNDGYIIEIARNPNFTQDTVVHTQDNYEKQTGSYYGGIPTGFHPSKSFEDDESYYWRIRYRHERYDGASEYDVGPWSQPMRFKLTSYQPGNPATTLGNQIAGEPAHATPSFTWQRVEGAARYNIQIDNDANLNSPFVNKTIDGNSYTALETIEDGTYYWRVAMRRSDNVLGQWTSIISFTKTSLVPTLISPINGEIVNNQPTLIWATAISDTGELHVAASRYRLQWADNPQFNDPTTVETEAVSFTPIKGQSLNDGTWFWRVAVIDGNGKAGPYSAAATFYKEYLRPATLSPVQGSNVGETITFEWTPLDGAAYYKLEIDDNEAFDSPIRVSTDNTRYTHTEKFAPGEYYWRVQMVDQDNKPGPTIPGHFSQGPDTPGDVPSVFMPLVLAPAGE